MSQITAQYSHQYFQPVKSSFSILSRGYQSVCLSTLLLCIRLARLIDACHIANELYFFCKNILDILAQDLKFHAQGNQHLLSSKSLLRVRNLELSRWIRKTIHGKELSFSFFLIFLSKLSLRSCLVLRCFFLLEFCSTLFLLILLMNGE